MDITKKLEPHFPGIERVLIVLIFLSVFLNYFMNDLDYVFSMVLIVLQVALIIFYFIQLHIRLYALIWAGFLIGLAAFFLSSYIGGNLYLLLNTVGYVAFGVIVLVKAIRVSMQHKNFELLNFIMGFLLVMQVGLFFANGLKPEIVTFYTFALSFSIGTIMYNDNLWHQYHDDEKNIIKYILMVALVMVLQSSFKYLNI
jgi:hypothetical protein